MDRLDGLDRFDAAGDLLLDEARESLKRVDRSAIAQLIDDLQAARHVVIFGRGRSGMMARAFAIRLGHLGFNTYFVGETSTPPVRDEDLVLLVSGSGETFSVTLTAQIAKDLDARVACVTESPESALAEICDLTILLPVNAATQRSTELAPLGTRFEAAANLLFDGVVAELMSVLGEDEASMASRHATLE